jgi:hypothetical protein
MSQTCTTAEVISPRQDVIPNGRPLSARFLVAEHDDPAMFARIDVTGSISAHAAHSAAAVDQASRERTKVAPVVLLAWPASRRDGPAI